MLDIILVCGGRKYNNVDRVFNVLSKNLSDRGCKRDSTLIANGDCETGADSIAQEFGNRYGWHHADIPALWDYHGNPGGPIRNSIMVKLQPKLVISFPGGTGTNDMAKKARRAGIEVIYG